MIILFIWSRSFLAEDMTLVKLTDAVADGAVCLDGSPIAYYIRQNTFSTKWVVFFQGGLLQIYYDMLIIIIMLLIMWDNFVMDSCQL